MTEDPHPDIERLLAGIRDGDGDAREALLGAVYDELRRLAGGFMKRERADHTLQPTALVHEAWIRLAGDRGDYRSRAHFFGAASEAMRRILVDRARRLAAAKRGGDRARVTLHDLSIASEEPGLDLLALDEAIDELARRDGRLAEVVKLRYFIGLGVDETAEILDTSSATVVRDWNYARAWLQLRLEDKDGAGSAAE